MTRTLWATLILIPFAVSSLFLLVSVLVFIEQGELTMLVTIPLFGAISTYLWHLLRRAFQGDGLIADLSESGTERVNLAFGGKEPGFFTYLMYFLLGPLAIFIFNRGQFPRFPGPPMSDQARQFGTWSALLSTYGVLGIIAVALTDSFDHAVAIFVGFLIVFLLVGWVANLFIVFGFVRERSGTRDDAE